MNFGTFKTRLLLACGNLKSNHPLVSNTNGGGDFVNEGLRFTILRASQRYPNLDLFPELKDIEWTDVTVADTAYLGLPSDHLAIRRVFSLDSSTSPLTTLQNQNWRPLGYIEPAAYDQLTKPTSQIQYPNLYTLRENRIFFHPTPRTTKTTYVKIDGFEDEPDMSAATDTPRTNARWHPAVLDAATYLMKNAMNHEDAERFLKSCDEKIEAIGASLVGLRRGELKKTVKVAGTPRGNY